MDIKTALNLATVSIDAVVNNSDISQEAKEMWLMSIAAIAIENVNPELRSLFFEGFESIKDMVDAECGRL